MMIQNALNTNYQNKAEHMPDRQAGAVRNAEVPGRTEAADRARAMPGKNEPQDEYISHEKDPAKKPTGIYSLAKDAQGNPKISYEDPNRTPSGGTENTGQPEAAPAEPEKSSGDNGASGAPEAKDAEECTANTDNVDREIEKLKRERQSLEQQIKTAGDDETKVNALKSKLAGIENELSQKDNDTYRKSHSCFS